MGGTFDLLSAQLASFSTVFGLGTVGLVSGVAARCWVLRDRAGLLLSGSWVVLFPCGPFRRLCCGDGVGGPPVL